jgi:DNA-binding HxlR family transcriptional regulator
MRRYGQFCPVAKAVEVFCPRWNALILRNILWGAERFTDIRRGVPIMSQTLLSQRLRQLEAEGVVARRRDGRAVFYQLTEAGRDFAPMIEAMGIWGQRWARRELAEGEVDMDLLLWGLELSVDPDALGRRAVVRVEFTDAPDHKRFWWYLCEDGSTQLCIDDPGGEPDLYIAGTVADLIRVYRGDIRLGKALDEGRLEAIGRGDAEAALAAWLNLSPLAEVRPRWAG